MFSKGISLKILYNRQHDKRVIAEEATIYMVQPSVHESSKVHVVRKTPYYGKSRSVQSGQRLYKELADLSSASRFEVVASFPFSGAVSKLQAFIWIL